MQVGFHSVINQRQENQDHHCMFYDGERTVLAVLDGHGSDGGHASKHFGKIISNPKIWQGKSTLDVISDVTKMENENVSFDIYGSGTTLIMLVKLPQKVQIVNIGDSRMAIFIHKNGFWNMVALTNEHKFHDPIELERAISSGHQVIRGYVHSKDRTSGLNVSRTLGDLRFKHTNAVSNVPDFHEVEFPKGTKIAAVLASDGLWDAIDPLQILQYLEDPPMKMAHDLVHNAVSTGNTRDNITVITTKFET
jgi:serine/threonine protein phosphatase PrpC